MLPVPLLTQKDDSLGALASRSLQPILYQLFLVKGASPGRVCSGHIDGKLVKGTGVPKVYMGTPLDFALLTRVMTSCKDNFVLFLSLMITKLKKKSCRNKIKEYNSNSVDIAEK